MGTWTNDDGLYIRYGTSEDTQAKGGSYPTGVAGMHVSEVRIADMTTLSTTDTIMSDSVIIPAGAFISKVELLVDTACTSGGAAILDVGLIRLDRSTQLDYDGFIASGALTTMDADGDIVEYTQGSTAHGALIGTALAYAGLVTASEADANAYTAGAVRIRIYWYIP